MYISVTCLAFRGAAREVHQRNFFDVFQSVLAAFVAKPTLHRSSVQFCLFFFLLNTQPFPQHFQNCVGSQILHFWNRVPPGRWFPFGPGITQGVETRYKGYLRVRGRSRINGRVGFLEVGSPDPVSVAGHPEV